MSAGNHLGTKMDRLSQASSALNVAINWVKDADVMEECDVDTPQERRPSVEQA